MSFQYDFYDKMIERLRSGIKSSYKFKDNFVIDDESFEKDSLFGGNIERPERPEIQINSESNDSESHPGPPQSHRNTRRDPPTQYPQPW